MSRYLEAQAFCDEAKKLKAVGGNLSINVLERLERQRSLIPKLRLRYPDPIERRWLARARTGTRVHGLREPNGPRWAAACGLEKARHGLGDLYEQDPTKLVHPFDRPEASFRQFIQRPARRKFVPWKDYRVAIGRSPAKPRYHTRTAITYYSAWQVLLFAEVANMGVTHFLNLEEVGMHPSPEVMNAAPAIISWEPVHAMRDFRDHERALDAVVWFAEEAQRGYMHATRQETGRRLLNDAERAEIMRTRLWAAREARRRYKVAYQELLACVRFLCERWAHWNGEGRPLIADAYKSILAQAVRLTCFAGKIDYPELRDRVGRAGGYFSPILDQIWTDWRAEQRDYLRRILVSMSRPDARVQAPFTGELIDRFLDFIEARTNRHSPHPDHGGGEMDEGEEVSGSSVEACCEAPEVFEFVEASLDAVAASVECGVVRDRHPARAGGRDDGFGAEVFDELAQGGGVIGAVGEDGPRREAMDEGWCGEDVVALSGGDEEADRPAERVRGHVDLGGQSSSATPQSLIAGPPFPFAACWCALTRVLSSIR